MSILPTKQPSHSVPVSRRENGDPMPQMMTHDNNRAGSPMQMKNKVFQVLEERYNNGAAPTWESGYDPHRVVGQNGPYNY